MKVLDLVSTACELAKALGKPVLFLEGLNFDAEELADASKAAPFINIHEHAQCIGEGCAFVVCDSEEEVNSLYDRVVGDDGPTKLNNYNGPHRVYALTIDAEGQTHRENT